MLRDLVTLHDLQLTLTHQVVLNDLGGVGRLLREDADCVHQSTLAQQLYLFSDLDDLHGRLQDLHNALRCGAGLLNAHDYAVEGLSVLLAELLLQLYVLYVELG